MFERSFWPFIYSVLLSIPLFPQHDSSFDRVVEYSDLYEETLVNDVFKLQFDTSKSKISFLFVEDDVEGTIEGLDFKINFNPYDTENAKFKGSVEVSTLDTGNFLRDGHLMWEKYFNKKQYPKITFESTDVVAFEKDLYKVIGLLNIKGIQKEIIISFKRKDDRLSGETTINTSDFDISIHKEKKENQLIIYFDFPFSNS